MGRLTPPTDSGDIHYVERPNPPGHFFTLFEGNDEPTDEAIGVSAYRVRYGTLASTFALSERTVTLTFPHAVRTATKAWIRYDRFAAYAPLGPTTESLRCTNGRPRHAVTSFITELDGTGNTGGTTPLPALTIDDAEGREGTNANIAFTVTLNPASSELVTVDYKTVARTATEGEDYTRTRGTLEFAPGETTKTVRVPIIDDTVEDDGETFLLDLYEASGATMVDTESWATGTIRNSEDAPTGNEHALTASFANVPAEHGGPGEANRFTFDLIFSEEPEIGYRKLRDDAFTISGGDVKKAKRKVQGSNRTWTITVEPDGWSNVNISLPGGRACTSHAAVCTDDGRMLSNTPSATVSGPGALSVADASAHENTDDALNFVVSLDRPSTLTVTADYATSNGTATAGADYTATSGTLTFDPGDVAKAILVPVLDDAIDDGGETMTLTLSNATNARIADGTATGTIENADPLQTAWIARFGRTVAIQVRDAIERNVWDRGAPANRVTIAGHTVNPDGVAQDIETPGTWEERFDQKQSLRLEPETRTMTAEELIFASAFELGTGGENGAPAWSAWGNFSAGRFEANVDEVVLDGDVTTGILGADVSRDSWLVGLALSSSKGDGTFRMNDTDRPEGRIDSTLTAIHPYARFELTKRLDAWALGGFGRGTMAIDDHAAEPIETDIGMTMGAIGTRGKLLDADENGGLDLALKADATWVRMTSDEADGDTGTLAAANADVTQVRLVLDGSRAINAGEDGTLTPGFEIGLRHDGGDAETGMGLEVGGRVQYAKAGFSIEGAVRGLIAHEEGQYEDWGVSGSIKLDPTTSGRGLSLSVAPTLGTAASTVERLWSLETPTGLARDDSESELRLATEIGYGIGLRNQPGVVTPYTGFSLAEGSNRTWRAGARWNVAPGAILGLEGTRDEGGSEEGAVQSIMLRATARW